MLFKNDRRLPVSHASTGVMKIVHSHRVTVFGTLGCPLTRRGTFRFQRWLGAKIDVSRWGLGHRHAVTMAPHLMSGMPLRKALNNLWVL